MSNAYDPIVHINTATGKSRVRLTDPAWLNEREDIGPDRLPGTADDTGRLVHVQPDDYTEIAGHRLEGSLSGPVGSKMTFHISAQTDMQPAQRPDPALRGMPNIQITGKLSFNRVHSRKVGSIVRLPGGEQRLFELAPPRCTGVPG